MTKNQKLLLGVGVLGVAGYLIWKQNQKPAAAASFLGDKRNALGSKLASTMIGCPCKQTVYSFTDEFGRKFDMCKGGQACCVSGTAEKPCEKNIELSAPSKASFTAGLNF